MATSSRLLSEERNLLEESDKRTDKLDFITGFTDNDVFNQWVMRTFQGYIDIGMKDYDL